MDREPAAEIADPRRAEAPASAEPLLFPSQERRNVFVFASCTALQYLAAPVLYVGLTQGSLLNRLEASRTVANLPETAFFVFTFTPVLLAWWLPGVKHLKRCLAGCYLITAAVLASVFITLILPTSREVRIAAVVLQGAVSGAAMTTAIALLWEAIGRGASESRRALALSLAFGAGPFLAFAGSLGQQLLLAGNIVIVSPEFFQVQLETPAFPWNFALLFAAGVPVMLLAAWLSATLVIPPAEDEPRGAGPLLGMYNFLSQPVLLRATIVTILLYVGNTITANMNLYSKYVMGGEPEAYAGYQNALRFAFKGAFGFLIGSWLTRASPRAGIVVTGLVFVAAQLWALFATGNSYLLAFGIYGAGELVGVYAPNYILSASRRRDLRRNMAFVTMMMVPAAPAGALFGAIVDLAGPWLGAANAFRLSFVVCCAFLVAGLALALVVLPARPSPNEN